MPMKLSVPAVGSYTGSAGAIGASLTLGQIGILVGIVTAIITCAANLYFSRRRDERERRQEEREQRELELKEATRKGKK